jgi:hypothetical protein
MRKLKLKQVSNLAQVTQPGCGKAVTSTQAVWLQSHQFEEKDKEDCST